MMRIKCPHCGAGNREAEQTSTCWQCGKSLWEPVSRQTYALKGMPPLSATTSLESGQTPELHSVTRDVRIAALAAVLALLLSVAVAIVFLHSSPVPDNTAPAPLSREAGR
jgi:predicted amidophosphoribosyltransferase